MNESLERQSVINNMTFDLSWKYGFCLSHGEVPEEAKPALQELAQLAERDITWAIAEVVEEYDYRENGGYL